MGDGAGAHALVLLATAIGFVFAAYQHYQVRKVAVDPNASDVQQPLMGEAAGQKVFEIFQHIQEGAKAFLHEEYTYCGVFVALFSIVVFVLTSREADGHWDFTVGCMTAGAYIVGSVASIVSGYLGMMVAVSSNARTTIEAQKSWTACFNLAFQAGTVMGFFLCSLGLLSLYALIRFYELKFPIDSDNFAERTESCRALFECIAGFGLGASSVALFGRVGGGIYTKAADVGADLAGKVIEDLPEDDPRNPAVIADNVGDNVGDVAGMGADLFGSFAEATCAALVVATTSPELMEDGWGSILFPLSIMASGLIVCLLTSFVATHIMTVKEEKDVELVLKIQLGLSSFLLTVMMWPISLHFLPETFDLVEGDTVVSVRPAGAYLCVVAGVLGGCFIGFITEYYTSHSYHPVREVAMSCETGAATNIIYGLSLGYKSAIIPVFIIAFAVYVSFSVAGMYGVALSALGMLGTLPTCLSIDVYGPVCDNAGGIAEMAGLSEEVRDKTDALDAAGNTTAAIGKGFAIGSAALVSLALFGAFITRVGRDSQVVNVLQPVTFSALFVGAMLPYWFTAMTMKSVGTAAMEMVTEVKRQFAEIPGLLEGTPGHAPPDHAKCIAISTDASLREMILPGVLVIFSPIITGMFFGVDAVSGLLIGSLTSGVQLAISQSNSGGAWDNAKKYVEKGAVTVMVDGKETVMGKGSEIHKAAVVGDTVGDPLKDTSGPALNILMKLMAIISLVFADFFMSINEGRGVFDM